MKTKIKLVVVNENTLGCIFPETQTNVQVLRASVLKGSRWHDCENYSITGASVRLASAKDFNDFQVVFDGYQNDANEFEFSKDLETLTIDNAETASTIINKNNPDWGTKSFTFVPGDNCYHGRGANSAMLFEHSYKFWSIATYK